MGNNDSKQGKSSRRISASEIKNLAARLRVKSESDSVSEINIFESLSWTELANPITAQLWSNLSSGSPHTKFSSVLNMVDSMIYQDIDHASKYLCNMLDIPLQETAKIYTQNLIKLFNTFHSVASDSWLKQGVTSSDAATQRLTDQLSRSLQNITAEDNGELVLRWLQRETLLYSIQRTVLCNLFKLHSSSLPEIIPLLTCQLSLKPKPTLLDLCDIMLINHSLPHDMQSEWSLLFSTRIHGLSFTSMLAKLTNKGQTVIIIEDTNSHVFGGFASESWRVGPKFIGDGRCFLFKLQPIMSVYTATGYNDHYMYLNHQQQTMPNGLGMGGQLNHFGLWVDADFGTGHSSEGCSSFQHMPTLSSQKEFTIEHIEVWAVGPPPKEDSDDETDGNKRSILDKDSGAKAMLELVDRGHHSEGLRELPEETY